MSKLLSLIFLFAALVPELAQTETSGALLVKGASKQIGITVSYDPSYKRLDYPGGDVPLQTGVCTDVIIRAYREMGRDLQKLVHEDMSANFHAYPSKHIWGLSQPDRNIDHRRVPNLQTFFSRRGQVLSAPDALREALPGDILTWELPSGAAHIGIVTDKRSEDGRRPLVVHNIGHGTLEEDVADNFKITGWYRYLPE